MVVDAMVYRIFVLVFHVHGVFVLFKFLKKIKFKENFSYIKILFTDAAKYNYNVNIKKINIHKEKKIYELIQLNNVIARIELGFFFEDIKIRSISARFGAIWWRFSRKKQLLTAPIEFWQVLNIS